MRLWLKFNPQHDAAAAAAAAECFAVATVALGIRFPLATVKAEDALQCTLRERLAGA